MDAQTDSLMRLHDEGLAESSLTQSPITAITKTHFPPLTPVNLQPTGLLTDWTDRLQHSPASQVFLTSWRHALAFVDFAITAIEPRWCLVATTVVGDGTEKQYTVHLILYKFLSNDLIHLLYLFILLCINFLLLFFQGHSYVLHGDLFKIKAISALHHISVDVRMYLMYCANPLTSYLHLSKA